MEKCYEYLGCGQLECIMYGRKDGARCWELEGTLCNYHGIGIIREKIKGEKVNTCFHSGCIYFKAANYG